MEKATFGAGCFWGVEETFRHVKGVVSAAVGYMGGSLANPTYEDVCTDKTGHAEVVQVEYDPAQVAYDELLASGGVSPKVSRKTWAEPLPAGMRARPSSLLAAPDSCLGIGQPNRTILCKV